MSTSPPRVCARCRKPAPKGKPCACRPAWEGSQEREPRGRRWRKVRDNKLLANPFCERADCPRVAAEVDHILPLAEGGDRYEWSNLMSLCKQHHQQKTTQDALRGKRRPRGGSLSL